MPNNTAPTPRLAKVLGLVFTAAGTFPILVALGVVHPDGGTGQTPPWVVFITGMIFVLAGCWMALSYGTGLAVDSNGNLDSSAPLAMQATQAALVVLMVSALGIVMSWIAFGPGERHFTTTISLPIGARRSHGSSIGGRIAFGVVAMLCWLMVTLATKQSIARLQRLRVNDPSRA